jgi:hypothetical protein
MMSPETIDKMTRDAARDACEQRNAAKDSRSRSR